MESIAESRAESRAERIAEQTTWQNTERRAEQSGKQSRAESRAVEQQSSWAAKPAEQGSRASKLPAVALPSLASGLQEASAGCAKR